LLANGFVSLSPNCTDVIAALVPAAAISLSRGIKRATGQITSASLIFVEMPVPRRHRVRFGALLSVAKAIIDSSGSVISYFRGDKKITNTLPLRQIHCRFYRYTLFILLFSMA
jgi:hypothetical protein